MANKFKGKMQEAAGAITGDEDKKVEGRAQQRKDAAKEKAAQKERTRRAEAEAKQAERSAIESAARVRDRLAVSRIPSPGASSFPSVKQAKVLPWRQKKAGTPVPRPNTSSRPCGVPRADPAPPATPRRRC